jgi:hypothetical protein
VGEPEREGEVLEIIEDSTSVTYRVLWRDGRPTSTRLPNDRTRVRAEAALLYVWRLSCRASWQR